MKRAGTPYPLNVINGTTLTGGRRQVVRKSLVAVLGLFLAATCTPAVATAADDWKFGITPYLWGAGVDGTLTVLGYETAIDKSFSDILSDLDFGFMVNLQARKDRFGLYSDVMFLSVSDANDVAGPGGAATVEVTASADQWMIDFGASWEVARWAGTGAERTGFLDLMVGGRYWDVDNELKAEGPFFGHERSVSKDLSWVDPIIGARFATNFTPKVSLIGRADVGGFDIGDASKLTWSASAYLGWRFSPLISGWAGWKYLSVEREEGDATIDLAMSGPVIGVSFTF
jgi:hypothetical protein